MFPLPEPNNLSLYLAPDSLYRSRCRGDQPQLYFCNKYVREWARDMDGARNGII